VLKGVVVVFLMVIVVLMTLTPPAYTQNRNQIQTQLQNWSTCKDPKLGISIKYPSGWEIEEGPDFVKFYPYGKSNESVFVGVFITKPLPEYVNEPKKLMQYYINEFRSMILRIYGVNGTIMVDNRPAYSIDYSFEGINDSEGSHRINYFLINKSTGYNILLKTEPNT
jgi:PsbP-like protein